MGGKRRRGKKKKEEMKLKATASAERHLSGGFQTCLFLI